MLKKIMDGIAAGIMISIGSAVYLACSANGEIGTKLLLILTETAATVVASYFAPAGATVINAVIEYTTLIIDKILSVLPRGVSLIYDKILLIKFSL